MTRRSEHIDAGAISPGISPIRSSAPKQEIDQRIDRLKHGMSREGLYGALIVQTADLIYYAGTAQDAHLFVPVDGDPVLMVRKSYGRACDESPLENIVAVTKLAMIADMVSSHASPDGLAIGMELDVLPVNNYTAYRTLLPESDIQDVSPLIRRLRMVKSRYELERINEAANLNDRMFEQVAKILKPGMTEIAFAGRLEAFYRECGHQGYVRVRSFNQEVFYGHLMSGSNLAVAGSALGPTGGAGPHASFPQSAGLKTIARNEPVMIDYVGIHEGYMVDQARIFSLGQLDERFHQAHDTALAIQEAAVCRGVPGTPVEELYFTALRIARDAGLADHFMGSGSPVQFLGHGLGLEIDEWPVVGRNSPHVLEQGMVLALEPKFIFPGQGLAGIENTFVVAEKGLERLTHFDDAIQTI